MATKVQQDIASIAVIHERSVRWGQGVRVETWTEHLDGLGDATLVAGATVLDDEIEATFTAAQLDLYDGSAHLHFEGPGGELRSAFVGTASDEFLDGGVRFTPVAPCPHSPGR